MRVELGERVADLGQPARAPLAPRALHELCRARAPLASRRARRRARPRRVRRRRRSRVPDHGAHRHRQDHHDPEAARHLPAGLVHLRRPHARRTGRVGRRVSQAAHDQPAHAACGELCEPDASSAHRARRPGAAAFARGPLDRHGARRQGLARRDDERDRAGADPAPEVRRHEARARRAALPRGTTRGPRRDRASRATT